MFYLHFFGAYSGVIFPCLLLLGYLLNNVFIYVSNFPERLYFFFSWWGGKIPVSYPLTISCYERGNVLSLWGVFLPEGRSASTEGQLWSHRREESNQFVAAKMERKLQRMVIAYTLHSPTWDTCSLVQEGSQCWVSGFIAQTQGEDWGCQQETDWKGWSLVWPQPNV